MEYGGREGGGDTHKYKIDVVLFTSSLMTSFSILFEMTNKLILRCLEKYVNFQINIKSR